MKLISIDPQFVVILDLWDHFVLTFFSLKIILWYDQFIQKLFFVSLFLEHYLSDIHEIAKGLRRA